MAGEGGAASSVPAPAPANAKSSGMQGTLASCCEFAVTDQKLLDAKHPTQDVKQEASGSFGPAGPRPSSVRERLMAQKKKLLTTHAAAPASPQAPVLAAPTTGPTAPATALPPKQRTVQGQVAEAAAAVPSAGLPAAASLPKAQNASLAASASAAAPTDVLARGQQHTEHHDGVQLGQLDTAGAGLASSSGQPSCRPAVATALQPAAQASAHSAQSLGPGAASAQRSAGSDGGCHRRGTAAAIDAAAVRPFSFCIQVGKFMMKKGVLLIEYSALTRAGLRGPADLGPITTAEKPHPLQLKLGDALIDFVLKDYSPPQKEKQPGQPTRSEKEPALAAVPSAFATTHDAALAESPQRQPRHHGVPHGCGGMRVGVKGSKQWLQNAGIADGSRVRFKRLADGRYLVEKVAGVGGDGGAAAVVHPYGSTNGAASGAHSTEAAAAGAATAAAMAVAPQARAGSDARRQGDGAGGGQVQVGSSGPGLVAATSERGSKEMAASRGAVSAGESGGPAGGRRGGGLGLASVGSDYAASGDVAMMRKGDGGEAGEAADGGTTGGYPGGQKRGVGAEVGPGAAGKRPAATAATAAAATADAAKGKEKTGSQLPKGAKPAMAAKGAARAASGAHPSAAFAAAAAFLNAAPAGDSTGTVTPAPAAPKFATKAAGKVAACEQQQQPVGAAEQPREQPSAAPGSTAGAAVAGPAAAGEEGRSPTKRPRLSQPQEHRPQVPPAASPAATWPRCSSQRGTPAGASTASGVAYDPRFGKELTKTDLGAKMLITSSMCSPGGVFHSLVSGGYRGNVELRQAGSPLSNGNCGTCWGVWFHSGQKRSGYVRIQGPAKKMMCEVGDVLDFRPYQEPPAALPAADATSGGGGPSAADAAAAPVFVVMRLPGLVAPTTTAAQTPAAAAAGPQPAAASIDRQGSAPRPPSPHDMSPPPCGQIRIRVEPQPPPQPHVASTPDSTQVAAASITRDRLRGHGLAPQPPGTSQPHPQPEELPPPSRDEKELAVCGVVFIGGSVARKPRAGAAAWSERRLKSTGAAAGVPVVEVPGLDDSGRTLPGWTRKRWHALFSQDPDSQLCLAPGAAGGCAQLRVSVIRQGLCEMVDLGGALPEGPVCRGGLRPCRDEERGGLGVCTEAAIARGAPVGVLAGYVMQGRRHGPWDSGSVGDGKDERYDTYDAAVYAREGYKWVQPEALEELRRRSADGGGGCGVDGVWPFLAMSFQMPYPDELTEMAPQDVSGGGPRDPRQPAEPPRPHVLCMLGHGNVLSLVNDARVVQLEDVTEGAGPLPPADPNCVILPVSVRGVVLPVLVALRDIAPGEQLLVDYGEGWWRELAAVWEVAVADGASPCGMLHEAGEVEAAQPAEVAEPAGAGPLAEPASPQGSFPLKAPAPAEGGHGGAASGREQAVRGQPPELSSDRGRDRNRSRDRDRNRDRKRSRSRSRSREQNRDRHHHRHHRHEGRGREPEREGGRGRTSRSQSRDRDRGRRQSRERERDADRHRERDRERDRDRRHGRDHHGVDERTRDRDRTRGRDRDWDRGPERGRERRPVASVERDAGSRGGSDVGAGGDVTAAAEAKRRGVGVDTTPGAAEATVANGTSGKEGHRVCGAGALGPPDQPGRSQEPPQPCRSSSASGGRGAAQQVLQQAANGVSHPPQHPKRTQQQTQQQQGQQRGQQQEQKLQRQQQQGGPAAAAAVYSSSLHGGGDTCTSPAGTALEGPTADVGGSAGAPSVPCPGPTPGVSAAADIIAATAGAAAAGAAATAAATAGAAAGGLRAAAVPPPDAGHSTACTQSRNATASTVAANGASAAATATETAAPAWDRKRDSSRERCPPAAAVTATVAAGVQPPAFTTGSGSPRGNLAPQHRSPNGRGGKQRQSQQQQQPNQAQPGKGGLSRNADKHLGKQTRRPGAKSFRGVSAARGFGAGAGSVSVGASDPADPAAAVAAATTAASGGAAAGPLGQVSGGRGDGTADCGGVPGGGSGSGAKRRRLTSGGVDSPDGGAAGRLEREPSGSGSFGWPSAGGDTGSVGGGGSGGSGGGKRGGGGGGGAGSRQRSRMSSGGGKTVYVPLSDPYRHKRRVTGRPPPVSMPDMGCEELLLRRMRDVLHRANPFDPATAIDTVATAAATDGVTTPRKGGCRSTGGGAGVTPAADAAWRDAVTPSLYDWVDSLRVQTLGAGRGPAAAPQGWGAQLPAAAPQFGFGS